MRGRSWIWLTTAGLVGAAAVTLVVLIDGTPAVGEDTLARAVQDIGDWFEAIAVVVRWVTTTEVVLALGFTAAVGLALLGDRRRALCFGAMLLLLPLAQTGLKELVDRERPSPAYVEVRDGWTSPSYPSGHVMSGTLLWGYVALSHAPRRLPASGWRFARGIAGAIVVLGLLANVFMGVHWPTDVLGGLFLGGALATGAIVLERSGPGSRERFRENPSLGR